jgi:putative transposase
VVIDDKPRLMSVAQPAEGSPYRGYRFPPEIIAHAVWLYFRFHLSFRDVEDLLAERGVSVSHESIRQWCTRFGATFAASQLGCVGDELDPATSGTLTKSC